jgi:hypothetical protein
VPLSEDEQRILSEIERRFYESDPKTAHQFSTTTLYRHAGRNCKWAAVGFVIGLVFLLATFASSPILGVVGFAMMLASAIFFERNLRKMGRASWHDLTAAMRTRGGPFGDAGKKLRDRFRRDE